MDYAHAASLLSEEFQKQMVDVTKKKESIFNQYSRAKEGNAKMKTKVEEIIAKYSISLSNINKIKEAKLSVVLKQLIAEYNETQCKKQNESYITLANDLIKRLSQRDSQDLYCNLPSIIEEIRTLV